MINLAPYIIEGIVGIPGSIIAAVFIYVYKKSVASYIVRLYFWIANKNIEISDFKFSMFFEQGFNIDNLQGIGDRLAKKNFRVKFIKATDFILTRKFSYELEISEDQISNDWELERFQYSVSLAPSIKVFSYRTDIEELTQEMIDIVESLSSLGLSPAYYITIKLAGKVERIRLENTSNLAKEVRNGATIGKRETIKLVAL